MRNEVRWERLFPDELERRFAECPLVVFPYGLCEPHGPHDTVGLDALKAHGIARRFAERFGGIVAPVDYWHVHEHVGYASWSYKSVGEVARTWLTSVPAWHHFKTVLYHVRAAEAQGFKAAIFLTGHYGPNWKDLKTLLTTVQPRFAVRLYGLPDFEANHRGFDNDGKSGGDHAGKVETSLLWALEPDCVDLSRIPREARAADAAGGGTDANTAWARPPYFAMGENAVESDRRVGERMVEEEIQFLTDLAQRLLSEFEEPESRRVPTFEEVEEIWDSDIKPILHTFESLLDFHQDIGEPPAGSVWHAQYRVKDPNR